MALIRVLDLYFSYVLLRLVAHLCMRFEILFGDVL